MSSSDDQDSERNKTTNLDKATSETESNKSNKEENLEPGDEEVKLKLLIVTGQTAEFIFNIKKHAAAISKYVWDNWPKGELF